MLVHFSFQRISHNTLKVFSFLLFFCFTILSVFAQQKITGIVLNDANFPLSGATIINVTSSNFTALSLSDGSFTIDAKTGDVLEVSFVGFKTEQIKIASETSLRIILQATVVSLDDVVLTGYISQKIKEITGSVAVVKPNDLTAVPAGQVEQMLQGRVAGLNIITSGMPGAASNVFLHGIGNFGDVTPLYIIDGVQGNINNLNPNDIESLQVLKDAGAYSIYGVRGANGVIIITTKKGRGGKTKISYDFYIGTTRPLKKGPDLLNPQEQADLTWLAKRNSHDTAANGNPSDPLYGNGANPILPDYFVVGQNQGLFEGDPAVNPDKYNIDPGAAGGIYQIVKTNKAGTDWFHELFKPAITQNHTITATGGNDKNKYLFSLGFLDQQGTLLNTYLKRFTARINTEFSVNNNFRLGENLQLTYSDNPRTGDNRFSGEIFSMFGISPILPVYDIKGGWASFNANNIRDNPVAARVMAKDNKTNNWEIFGNAFCELDFLKNFTARTSFGGSLNYKYSYDYVLTSYNPLANGLPNNSFNETSGYTRSWTWTNTLTFSKTFNNHSVKALVGTEAINNYDRELGGRRVGYLFNDPDYRFLSNGSPANQSNYSVAGTSALFSFISDINYGFKEKYLLKVTLRRDGSSVFGPENRYGWFPSVSAAWRITEENFMEQFKWLNDLKLRASWGKTGYYGNTNPFNQYTLYGGSVGDAFYDINGTSNSPVRGFRVISTGEPKTGWQEDIVINAGFEGILWNGKLSVTADFYKKKSSGLLFPVSLPDILGGAIPPNVNVGTVRNTGVDVLLGSKGRFSKSWNWDFAMTFTTYNNKILRLTDLPYFHVAGNMVVRNEVGHQMSSFYGYKIIGFFQDSADVANSPVQNAAKPGRFKYADFNGKDSTGKLTGKPDGRIDDDDRVHFGNANPKFTLGINIAINFRSFDLSAFFYGSFGNDVINFPKIQTDFFSGFLGIGNAKSKTALYDSWTPQHQNATAPIVENDLTFSNVGSYPNSYVLENGSYFRNKSLVFGYTLPKTFLNKISIEKLRIYVQAVNLFTLTKYTGLDPELTGLSQGYGVDFGKYPNNQKQYMFGLTMNF